MNKEKNNVKLRPMMKISEMVPYLKTKNIKFELISEDKAEKYLRDNNNYYNITSYKNNFEKYMIDGVFVNKYIDLDFAYLKDLAIIDHRVRLLFFKMIIDIEHYLKIRILNLIENIEDEDGYRIVNLYLEKDFNDEKFSKKVHNSIFKKVGSEYYQKIFSKYDIDKDKKLENIPVWEFLEIITLGELVNFYEFFSKEYQLKKEIKNIFILREIVKLRNAVAHNSCVLCDLDKKDNEYAPDFKIVNYLNLCGIGKETRNNKLSNSRIKQMTYTLYMFNEIVTSDGVKRNVITDINELFYERIILHKEYYNNNELLKSIYAYFDKIIKKYYRANID
ncbi:MAG: Abi family protein [Firmicutes bacterium]|nr:Abi family protein [Bacillota bacterium]